MAPSEAAGAVRQIHSHTSALTGHCQCGFLFDVTAKGHDVSVTAVSFVPGTAEGDYDIWAAPTGHERVHHDAKAWSLVAQGTHSGPRGSKLRINLLRHMKIPCMQRHAFYITGQNVNAVCFSTASDQTNSAEDDNVIIHLGHFKAFPWESVLSSGPFGHNGMQEFVGFLEYQVCQTEAADQIVRSTERLWETLPFPDAEIEALGGKRFKVHRSLMASASSYFDEAWSELPPCDDTPVLKVESPPEITEALLRFLYTGRDEGYTGSADPTEMLQLGYQYQLPVLVRVSAARLANQLSSENAVASVRALRPHRDHPLCEPAWAMMLANVQALLSRDGQLLEDVCRSLSGS